MIRTARYVDSSANPDVQIWEYSTQRQVGKAIVSGFYNLTVVFTLGSPLGPLCTVRLQDRNPGWWSTFGNPDFPWSPQKIERSRSVSFNGITQRKGSVEF